MGAQKELTGAKRECAFKCIFEDRQRPKLDILHLWTRNRTPVNPDDDNLYTKQDRQWFLNLRLA